MSNSLEVTQIIVSQLKYTLHQGKCAGIVNVNTFIRHILLGSKSGRVGSGKFNNVTHTGTDGDKEWLLSRTVHLLSKALIENFQKPVQYYSIHGDKIHSFVITKTIR